MLTSEQRFHLRAQAEYWDDEQHQTYAEAIRAALDTIEEQEAAVIEVQAERDAEANLATERLQKMCALARLGNKQAAELELLRLVALGCLGTVSSADIIALAREWRARFGKEARE